MRRVLEKLDLRPKVIWTKAEKYYEHVGAPGTKDLV